MRKQKRDWLKFWVHFFFGALAGAFAGFSAWAHSDYGASISPWPGLAFVGGGALILGITAGFAAEAGDRFWHDLPGWLDRWW